MSDQHIGERPAFTGPVTDTTELPLAVGGSNTLERGTALQLKTYIGSGSVTIDAAPTDGSSNAVSSNGVFDALAGKSDTWHNHSGVYDPAGTASSAVSTHVGLADPHTQYALESALGSAAAAATTDFAPASHVGAGGSAHANAVASGAAGFMTGADKAKLDGIAAGATVAPVASVAGRTGAVTLTSSDLTDTTAAGRALLDDADAAAQRTTLGLGDAATKSVGTTAGTVAAGDDPRLSDARTPTAHNQAASTISDSTTVGRAVLTAIDATAARSAIGAGTSSFDGAYASLSGKPTLGDAAAKNTGTTTGTVAAGDDARLGNERTPTEAGLASKLHGAAAKTTLVDADEVNGTDSAASWGLIRTTWANVTAYIKSKLWAFNDSSTTNAINLSNGLSQRWAPSTGSQTLSFTNWPASGQQSVVLIEGVNLGASTITWPSINWVKKDGTFTTTIATYLTDASITLQSSGTDFFMVWSRDGGTTLYGKFLR